MVGFSIDPVESAGEVAATAVLTAAAAWANGAYGLVAGIVSESGVAAASFTASSLSALPVLASPPSSGLKHPVGQLGSGC